MKIAIVSDIHANSLAFNKVLEDIEERKCDKLLCLGDYVMAGYDPNAIIEKLKFLKSDKSPFETELILGNTDLMVLHYSEDIFERVLKVAPCMAYSLKADLDLVNEDSKNFLKGIETEKEIEIMGLKIFMSHGSPMGIDIGITPDMKLDEVEKLTSKTDADIILCGHTHIPCGYQLPSGKTVINAGSIGRPMTKDPYSCYAIIEIDSNKKFKVEHHFIKYDNKKAAELIRKRGFKECEALADMFER